MRVTVGITGASGAAFAQHLLATLERDTRVTQVDCIVSDNALRVFAEELDVRGRNQCIDKLVSSVLEAPPTKLRQVADSDIGAGPASGSYPSAGMIVLPCSMGTLASIANGMAHNLISRAADVCLKERRPLVLCVRETPFNRIHLRNMTLAADAGATIFPVIPSFYDQPAGVPQMAAQFAARVLAHFGLPQNEMYRWRSDE